MKYIRIKFKDGNCFDVPAKIIAESRTNYYAELDGFKKGSKEWKEEFECSMDDYELQDWLENNMDWEDVKDQAILVPTEKFDYYIEFSNAEKEIVEHEKRGNE